MTVLLMVTVMVCSCFVCVCVCVIPLCKSHKFVCFDGAIIHFYSPVVYYTNYLAVHKPKFALVQDEALCGQKSQCSG